MTENDCMAVLDCCVMCIGACDFKIVAFFLCSKCFIFKLLHPTTQKSNINKFKINCRCKAKIYS